MGRLQFAGFLIWDEFAHVTDDVIGKLLGLTCIVALRPVALHIQSTLVEHRLIKMRGVISLVSIY